MDAIEQFLSNYGGDAALDLACGDGWFTDRLCSDLSRCGCVIGIDVDTRELEEARDELSDRPARFEVGTAMDLRFGAAQFDIVSVSNALHHIPRPEQALAEACRVLKPGGHLLVHEMVREVDGKDRENARDFHHLKARVDRLLGISHQETLAELEIIDLVDRAGLVISAVERYEPAAQSDADAIDARIEFLRDYIAHVMERNEFASIRKSATLLAERIRVDGFRAAPQLLIAAEKPRS